jgi:hypothetical protein
MLARPVDSPQRVVRARWTTFRAGCERRRKDFSCRGAEGTDGLDWIGNHPRLPQMVIPCARAMFPFLARSPVFLCLLLLPPEISFFGIFSLPPGFLSPAFRLISRLSLQYPLPLALRSFVFPLESSVNLRFL